jgi:hypothetical protein
VEKMGSSAEVFKSGGVRFGVAYRNVPFRQQVCLFNGVLATILAY